MESVDTRTLARMCKVMRKYNLYSLTVGSVHINMATPQSYTYPPASPSPADLPPDAPAAPEPTEDELLFHSVEQ